MNVLVRAERTPALIDERVNVIVHAVELECIDRQAVDASVGNVLRRASVQGLPLFFTQPRAQDRSPAQSH